MDVHVPFDPNQLSNRVFEFGSPCLGSSEQPMVEVLNECSTNFMGRGREVEQAMKAINDSTLQRIGMAHLGKEVGGLQRDSIGPLRESSNFKTNPDPVTS